jgi:structural maintenance of chromosome 3 (chondroitin sulfate proteoglycan 6)
LVRKLHTVNEGLKKFAHVNKKAFEQYNNFTKQRDQLLKRRDDLEKSGDSIEQLVEVLDQRKDEAIERTFKQVAKNFEEVFETLVPAGKGKLIIQRSVDQESTFRCDLIILLRLRTRMMMMPRRLKTPSSAPLTITQGWQLRCVLSTIYSVFLSDHPMKVSFNSKIDEGLRIQQLSGGQKSLVALALGAYLRSWLRRPMSLYFQFLPFKNVIRHRFICLMRCVSVRLLLDVSTDFYYVDRCQFRCSVSDCCRW